MEIYLVGGVAAVLIVVLATSLLRARKGLREVETKAAPYLAAHAAVETLERESVALKTEVRDRRAKWERETTEVVAEIQQLEKHLAVLRGMDDMQSYGLYRPHYDFGTSEEYRDKLEAVRDQQEALIKAGRAAQCKTEWSVESSKTKGRQMTDRYLKLQLRAFNGECDAAVAKVKFNNALPLEERMRKAFAAINKLGETQQCELSTGFLELKVAELRLAHEYAEQAQAEKEEQRRIKEQMKEEEQALKEIEKAQREAEKDEQKFEDALERARKELGDASDRQKATLDAKISDLERKLEEAHQNKERALSRAQMTKSGHVYVISNHGSFGEEVFKVGMTRRLDPMDRVRELGDASVPFAFDVHAVFFSDNAPELEAKLHRRLGEHRVNLVNERKEFFRVQLASIVQIVHECHGVVEFTHEPEAEEYRKTIALREERRSKPPVAAPAPAVQNAMDQLQRLRAAWADQ